MKKNILAAAICTVAAVSSFETMAYDSDNVVTGTRPTDVHFVRTDFVYADNGTSSIAGEGSHVYAIESVSTGPETFTKVFGDPDTGEVTTPYVRMWLPAINFQITNGTGNEATNYALTTATNGKITGGWLANESTSLDGGSDVFNYIDFDQRQVVTINVCDGIAPGIAVAQGVMDGTGGALPTNCELVQHGDIAYETCDTTNECGQLSKSVPVPAFASAVLALGLAGITLVTSRRRSIK